MRLAVKGLVDLDAPVSRYLKSWQFPRSTIRQKITYVSFKPHRRDATGRFPAISTPPAVMPNRDVSKEAVPSASRAGFSYSMWAIILENLMRDVTGQSFSEYLRSGVFYRCMESATFAIDTARRLAYGI